MHIKVVVALHKPYRVPSDPLYLPLQVGAAGKEGFAVLDEAGNSCGGFIQRDDEGVNISAKNPFYCELTGLYWAWKNLDADAIGLVHYRRHFAGVSRRARKGGSDKWNSILTLEKVNRLFAVGADIIIPNRRKYYIESLYSHYSHTLDAHHLDLARQIVEEKYPAYIPDLDRTYKQTWGYMFNMCIMSREWLDDYCTWLFDVLGELESRLTQELSQSSNQGQAQSLTPFEARIYGRVSEILFNVWLNYQLELATVEPGLKLWPFELETIHMESVNWFKKGGAFLAAKFFGKKYKKSF